MYRVIISGINTLTLDAEKHYDEFKKMCDKYLNSKHPEVHVLCPDNYGYDQLASRYAKEKYYQVSILRLDTKRFGKNAVQVANEQLCAAADALIAFWDGKPNRTKYLINEGIAKGLKIRIVDVNEFSKAR